MSAFYFTFIACRGEKIVHTGAGTILLILSRVITWRERVKEMKIRGTKIVFILEDDKEEGGKMEKMKRVYDIEAKGLPDSQLAKRPTMQSADPCSLDKPDIGIRWRVIGHRTRN